ncbi:putative actin-related protein 2/3 complex subunit 1A [Ascodesmis nigricans]|uniref:Actin-related protein 2/3 complex subunit n=1 Tax=Ascodesmis nigricans TaxID=341454 RepID=A0A4V3SJS0_9PEZI|nr:putative actin-related protein 2/3 complex subunit 1A [Ascodesmis nigricans]
MSAAEVNLLFHQRIADHSFSADGQLLAVTRDSRVQLYKRSGKTLALSDELTGHDKTITAVDIAPNSGKIVTCSQDRNAYVWELSPTGEWKPTLVLLRINRAATSVRWSPDETKFAVGSGARVISVCYFESENDWWVSKHLKKPIRSTILSVAWHPNSVLLAAGSADAHARVFSAFIKGVDQRPAPTAWGERLPFNTVCGEFQNRSGGWVHDVAFSPSGNALGFVAHDSSVTVVYPSAPEQPPKAVITVTTAGLPFTSLLWSREDQIIAAGHDCHPMVFEGSEDGWQWARNIDDPKKAALGEEKETSALNMFRQMDLRGKTTSSEDSSLKTIHQNTITKIRAYEGQPGAITKFSTSGVDGRVVIFSV